MSKFAAGSCRKQWWVSYFNKYWFNLKLKHEKLPSSELLSSESKKKGGIKLVPGVSIGCCTVGHSV